MLKTIKEHHKNKRVPGKTLKTKIKMVLIAEKNNQKQK